MLLSVIWLGGLRAGLTAPSRPTRSCVSARLRGCRLTLCEEQQQNGQSRLDQRLTKGVYPVFFRGYMSSRGDFVVAFQSAVWEPS